MKSKKVKKTLIEPKVRLLLWIYLHGVKNESNYLARLAKQIGYSEGSLKSHIIPRLLEKNLIESFNSDKESPPYKITEKGKKFLWPILFTRRIGLFIITWVGIWTLIDYLCFIDNPILMLSSWLPLLLLSFAILSIVLILYPYLLVTRGKIGY
jgi:predicted transcriptional regulator